MAAAGGTGEARPFGFDPYRDWAAARRRQLAAAGIELAPGMNDAEVVRAYLNVRRRRIEPKPRTLWRATSFSPRPEEAFAIAEIERRARAGQDLNAFLTTRSRKANERDGLLFDWDIHHLHLGLVLDASGFRKRTPRLLFARVTDEAFYLIAVGQHGDWADPALFEAIHDNWPATLEAFRIRSNWLPARGLTRGFSDRERHKLRKAGIQTMICTRDGTVYLSPGGGIATDRSNLSVTRDHMWLRAYFRFLEQHVRHASDRIREKAWAAGINPNLLQLRLAHEGEQPVAVDGHARLRVLLPTFDSWRRAAGEHRSANEHALAGSAQSPLSEHGG